MDKEKVFLNHADELDNDEVTDLTVHRILNEEGCSGHEAYDEFYDYLGSLGISVKASGGRKDTVNLAASAQFFSSLSSCQTMTPEEEQELVGRMRHGSPEESKRAFDELVRRYQKFVVSIAKQYIGMGDFLDLVQYGNEGLILAIKRYNPEHGARIGTYAEEYIRRKIIRGCYCDNNIPLPRYLTDKMPGIRAFYNGYIKEHGQEPSPCEMAEYLGRDKSVAEGVLRYFRPMVSTDMEISDDGQQSFIDTIPDAKACVEEEVMKCVTAAEVWRLIDKYCDDREKAVLRRKFGKDHEDESYYNRKIAKEFGFKTGESIRLIVKSGIRKVLDSPEGQALLAAC